MDQFDVIFMKHGELGLQAILENWERYAGIRPNLMIPLETRWERFLRETSEQTTRAAA